MDTSKMVMALYFVLLVLIALAARSQARRGDNLLLGGRQHSGLLTALAAGTSDMSSWLMLSLPALLFLDGSRAILLPVALLGGAYLNWRLVAPRLRQMSEQLDAMTIPEFFSRRLCEESRRLSLTLALAITVFFTLYTAASFLAGALLLQNFFSLSYHQALGLCTSIVLVYTVLGGFVAVTWIDFFQGILMFLALVIVPFSLVTGLVGSDLDIGLGRRLLALVQRLKTDHGIDTFAQVKPAYLLSCLAWGLGYFGQFHVAIRFMTVRKVEELILARRVCLVWMLVAFIGAITTGLFSRLHFRTLEQVELLFVKLANELFQPWLSAAILSAVVSAIMSSASAQLLLSASAISEDLLPTKDHKNHKRKRQRAVLSLLSVAIMALALAWNPSSSIFSFVAIAWAGIGAAFGPLMLFALYWQGLTHHGAFAGIVFGGSSVLLIESLSAIGIVEDALAGFSLVPGFLISSIAILVFSGNRASKEARYHFQSLVAGIRPL